MESYYNITTEKAEALRIVRSILSKTIDPDRITCGDAKCYFPILLDGKHQKPICRLYFQRKMAIGTISTRKVETRANIQTVREISNYSFEMLTIIKKYIE